MANQKRFNFKKHEEKFLRLLARDFPTIPSVTTEIINLEAILHLPKPTEHFIADVHGEFEAFQHVLRNASGNIKRKVKELYVNSLRDYEIRELCTLIYYPEQKLELVKLTDADFEDFCQTNLNRLIAVCRRVSSKYTRSKVRKSLPSEFAYIIEELMHESVEDRNKQAYINVIIQTIIGTKRAEAFIIALCQLIQRLSVDQLHLLGDIFDRGPGAHLILDTLQSYHSWDITWGNHDMLWIGAAAGNKACVANALRISLRYGNMQSLEEGYGINLVPLTTFAIEKYDEDDCKIFMPKILLEEGALIGVTEKQRNIMAKMHKAIAVIQFKLEGQLYAKHPEWNMQDRMLLDGIEGDKIRIGDKEYPLIDSYFPTINPDSPYELTAEEHEVMERLTHSFSMSERLQRHVRLLLTHGGMYSVYNGNLLFHASVPLNERGTFKSVDVFGEQLEGRELMDKIEAHIRQAFDVSSEKEYRETCIDYFLYLWCGADSPLFDKSKMATFERYFIENKETHEEEKGCYYLLRDKAEVCDYILDEFGVKGEHRHIINGHVPVKVGKGETPIKADGRLMVIDGGFSKAYHRTTGIAGYTLVYHSRGFQLVQHEPFMSAADTIKTGTDIRSSIQIVEMMGRREMVSDTDKGAELRSQIEDLEKLLYAYRKGIIKER